MQGIETTGYELLKALVEDMGGSMVCRRTASRGVWTLSLWGRSADFPVPDRSINPLDSCYEPPQGNSQPQTWDDWPEQVSLRPDARWRVVELIRQHSRS